jgi:hypothetical protein
MKKKRLKPWNDQENDMGIIWERKRNEKWTTWEPKKII